MVLPALPLNGSFTLKILRSVHDIYTTTIDFSNLHDVQQSQPNFLGKRGNYYYDGKYLLMAFGEPLGGINVQTKFMLFGQQVPGNNQLFEGVMCDNTTGDNMTWAAQLGGDFQPSLIFGANAPIDSKTFLGIESPHNVQSFYEFNYVSSNIGQATVGIAGKPPTFTGDFTSNNYGSSNQQLIVFGGENLRVYGGVVVGSGPGMYFIDGIYMHPSAGPTGNYGAWQA